MRTILRGSAIAAGVLAAGLLAGYWHFAELMPQRGSGAPSQPTPSPTGAASPSTIETSQPPAAPSAPVEPEARDTAALVPPAADGATIAATPEDGEAPTFELLRVEPDGSAVVAGRSAPGSEIVLRSGEEVLARDTAGAGGDFAMTLETPLAVGEHQLRLETIRPDGAAQTSVETAIVSVPPRGREEELLVAIDQPDAATRLLSVPTASQVAAPIVASAPEGQSEQTAADAVEPDVAADPADQGVDTASLADPAAPVESTAAASPAAGADDSDLSIAAVEIEGDQIYIAGRARPGSTVRLYLDDTFVAETDGRGATDEFVAEGTADVPVGSHVVRADTVGPDGSVIARVEVPFDRPDANSMAALAPSPETATASEPPNVEDDASPAMADPVASAQRARVSGALESAPLRGPDAVDTAAAPEGVRNRASALEVEDGEGGAAAAPLRPSLDASATQDTTSSGSTASSPERIQAALEPVEGRVIIRRGDTLWRISRNAYGLGSRYTVIYLANGDQIRNPDRIYPGQVFRMPGNRSAEGRSTLR